MLYTSFYPKLSSALYQYPRPPAYRPALMMFSSAGRSRSVYKLRLNSFRCPFCAVMSLTHIKTTAYWCLRGGMVYITGMSIPCISIHIHINTTVQWYLQGGTHHNHMLWPMGNASREQGKKKVLVILMNKCWYRRRQYNLIGSLYTLPSCRVQHTVPWIVLWVFGGEWGRV